jgi:hypothetical protein
VQIAIEKLKSHKSPGIDQIPAELIKAGGRKFAVRFISRSLLFGIRRDCRRERETDRQREREEWKESTLLSIYKNGDNIDFNSYRGISLLQLRTRFYPTSCSQG